jgi:OOP family OmpA-OmpF porin
VNRKLIAGSFAFATLASGSAFSQSYVGVAGGVSQINESCAAGISCDKNDTAAKIWGGYTFADNISAEVTYYSLGTFKNSTTVNGTSASASLKGSYWGLGGAWRPDFGNGWGAVGRLGAAYTQGKLESTGFGSQSRNSWQPYAGIGVTYAVTKDIKLEADYDYTRVGSQFTDPNTGTNIKGTNNVGAFMFGATFSF